MCPDADTNTATDDSVRVVTAFLRHRGDVLLLRRSDAVGTYQGRWGGVSGFAEGNPDEQVRVEIREETGLEPGESVSLVRAGRPVAFEDPALEREWVVHPFLFDCETREIELSEEHDALEWVSPTEMLTVEFEAETGDTLEALDIDRETVPKLWTAYERVAPTVRSITADGEHGAAYLSLRALEVLRDRAGVLTAGRGQLGSDPVAEWEELAELAGRLLETRPSMAVLRNRVNRVMADAGESADDAVAGAPAVLEAASTGLERAVAADADAAANASASLEGTVLTLSRSGTVLEALRRAAPSRVFVAESRPAREGIDVAEELVESEAVDCPVTVHTDAAVAHVLEREAIDHVVVGADTIRPDGAVVNKAGTRMLALVAAREDVPVTVVAATDKVSTRKNVNLESGTQSAVYDGDAALDVLNPTFDVTPVDYIEEFVTECGRLEVDDVSGLVEELRGLEDWRDS